jgi:hypothetical protein
MSNVNIIKNTNLKLNLIHKKINYFRIKNKNFKGCLDKDYLNKKNNFSSPPFQYFSLNYLNFNHKLKTNVHNNIIEEVKFLINLQNKDGSYDEWYKNERSFCTSSYTSFLISNLLLNNLEIRSDLKMDLLNSLDKSFYFLKEKINKNILNQNLAKLAFLQNYCEIKKERKNIFIKKELKAYSDKLYSFVMKSYEYEYEGVDLGYLTVSLMLSAEILKRKNSKKMMEIFVRLLHVSKKLTLDFKYFPNYIFSRSSRIFLISGFFYAFKQNMINKNDFKRILNFYDKNFKIIYELNNIKYLSFFYSTDQTLSLLDKSKKVYKKNLIGKLNNTDLDFFSLGKKNRNIFFYKKNPNLIAFNLRDRIHIHMCDNIIFKGNKYIPTILKNFSISKKKIIITQKFSKISKLKKTAFKYIKIISIISKIRIFNKLIDYLGKYFLIIKKKEIKDFKKFRTIYFYGNKIRLKDVIISSNIDYSITSSNEVHYFSPTSFLLKNEIMKMKKISVKKFNKMKKKVTSTIYEY